MVLYRCFFFNDTATTEIYTYGHTLSLHDALPILPPCTSVAVRATKRPTSPVWDLAWHAIRAASSGAASKAWAAYHTSDLHGSFFAVISAHMCLTAWKLPITRPNCSRCPA